MPRRRIGHGLFRRRDGTYHLVCGRPPDRILVATGRRDAREAWLAAERVLVEWALLCREACRRHPPAPE